MRLQGQQYEQQSFNGRTILLCAICFESFWTHGFPKYIPVVHGIKFWMKHRTINQSGKESSTLSFCLRNTVKLYQVLKLNENIQLKYRVSGCCFFFVSTFCQKHLATRLFHDNLWCSLILRNSIWEKRQPPSVGSQTLHNRSIFLTAWFVVTRAIMFKCTYVLYSHNVTVTDE